MEPERRAQLEQMAERMVASSFLAELEERERNRPENILAEITQCLEQACVRYLPEWFDQARLEIRHQTSVAHGYVDWCVQVRPWRELVVDKPSGDLWDVRNLDATARIRDVPGFIRGFRLLDIRRWVDGRTEDPGPGEVEIRYHCQLLGQELGRCASEWENR